MSDLSDTELLCLRFVDIHPVDAEVHESWTDLDAMVDRGLLTVQPGHFANTRRYYVASKGRQAMKAAMAKRTSGKPVPVPGERPSLKEAAESLAASLRDHPQCVCVGRGKDSLSIMADFTKYARSPLSDFAKEWEGWPVEVVDHGPMATMGGGTPKCGPSANARNGSSAGSWAASRTRWANWTRPNFGQLAIGPTRTGPRPLCWP